MTPLIEQYLKLKKENPDCILFFRLGDFYEMFLDDAIQVAPILGITLTKRGKEAMCGVPYHTSMMYIDRLLQKGFRVAVSEQDGEGETKKLMSRSVVRIYTPGTRLEEELIKGAGECFIASVVKNAGKKGYELVLFDTSRGDMCYKNLADIEDFESEIYSRNTEEFIVLDDDYYSDITQIRKEIDKQEKKVYKYPKSVINRAWAERELKSKFNVDNIANVLDEDNFSCWSAMSLMIRYLKEIHLFDTICISSIHSLNKLKYLQMTKNTISALELVFSNNNSKGNTTLFSIINNTETAMGERLLKQKITRPMVDKGKIEKNLDCVEFFINNEEIRSSIYKALKGVYDIERATSRLREVNCRKSDLLKIATSIKNFLNPFLKSGFDFKSFFDRYSELKTDELIRFSSYILSAIEDDIETENLIKDGFDSALDSLRKETARSEKFMIDYAEEQKQKYNISNLKLIYSRNVGYTMEVSKSQIAKVPPHWKLRQNLVNANRYTNEEFEELEKKKTRCFREEKILESEIYLKIVRIAISMRDEILILSSLIADVDLFISFANLSIKQQYNRPEITLDDEILIKGGRHPVVETRVDDFVQNDLFLKNDSKTLLLLTAPNMAGKSTYLRQNALIIIMAQMGCYVPAESAKIGIVEKIFSRIGSQDSIADGESTFYTEMKETAYILRNSDEKSFVIMDEVGRGTSANEGSAIAEAIMTYLIEKRIKCLFSTHYPELSEIVKSCDNAQNITLEVDESGNEIVFLRKVKNGVASSSYATHTAKIAGVPISLIKRAEKISREKRNRNLANEPSLFSLEKNFVEKEDEQAREIENMEEIITEIQNFDVMNSSPLEALQFINDLKKQI